MSKRGEKEWTPWSQVVDLVVNGDYRGTYTLADAVSVDRNRIDITEMTEYDVDEENITGGYLVQFQLYNRYSSSRSDRSQQVTPDFDVEIDEESNRLIVTLRNNIPALQISESYTLLNERYKSGATLSVTENKEKKVIIDAYQRASTFIELLKQRQQTLFATMNAIVKCQHDFFLSGDERDLKPLGQQQIADMIGKDVSVVSRAVNNKYVQLPWGVKSLKFFFREDINGASWHEVCDALKQLVEREDKKNPLSDDALCKQLKEMGYQLERRTVAKYRDTLGIPSSPIRRKMAK
jgi:RNA polymerase sigma-54 factor